MRLSPTDHQRTLVAGTYRVDGFAVPFAVTVPAGWIADGHTPSNFGLRNDNAFLALVVMTSVYADPCHTDGKPKPVGPGVDALVDGLSAMAGFTVSGVHDVTVGGARGKSFTLANTIDLEADRCSSRDIVWIGRDRDGEPVLETPSGADFLWAVDVSGTTVLMGGPAEIVRTISFGPASG